MRREGRFQGSATACGRRIRRIVVYVYTPSPGRHAGSSRKGKREEYSSLWARNSSGAMKSGEAPLQPGDRVQITYVMASESPPSSAARR